MLLMQGGKSLQVVRPRAGVGCPGKRQRAIFNFKIFVKKEQKFDKMVFRLVNSTVSPISSTR